MTETSVPSERLWYSWRTPHEKFGSLTAAMQERGMRRVLDLGCGVGRHLVFIHHNLIDGIRRTVAGVWRALQPGGWFFATANAWGDYKERRGPEIEPGTWLVHELDCHVSVPHHLFHEDELRSVWEGFRILELERKVHEWRDESGQPKLSAHWEVWAERVE